MVLRLLCRGARPPYASPDQLLLSVLVMAMAASLGALAGGRALRSANWSPILVLSCLMVLSSQDQVAGLTSDCLLEVEA
jgi:hypothetical protein